MVVEIAEKSVQEVIRKSGTVLYANVLLMHVLVHDLPFAGLVLLKRKINYNR